MRESLLKISYNMELSEIDEGFKLFYKKYQLKRTIIFTIVYAIAAVLGVDMVIRNPQNFYGYLLIGIGIGLIFMQWYRPVMIRKKLINTLSSMSQETYETEIFSDKITITTIVEETAEEVEKSEETEKSEEASEEATATEEKLEEAEGEAEENDSSEPEAVVSHFYFGSDLMDAMENEKMFLLFVNKSLIYIYPKRCLTEEEQTKLREIFTDKAIL
ncbi:MAG: YcxB family protein [Ruminiclostridium sp.]|nr:YcxB family protein [Ruminiclostridium sp.]